MNKMSWYKNESEFVTVLGIRTRISDTWNEIRDNQISCEISKEKVGWQTVPTHNKLPLRIYYNSNGIAFVEKEGTTLVRGRMTSFRTYNYQLTDEDIEKALESELIFDWEDK